MGYLVFFGLPVVLLVLGFPISGKVNSQNQAVAGIHLYFGNSARSTVPL